MNLSSGQCLGEELNSSRPTCVFSFPNLPPKIKIFINNIPGLQEAWNNFDFVIVILFKEKMNEILHVEKSKHHHMQEYLCVLYFCTALSQINERRDDGEQV